MTTPSRHVAVVSDAVLPWNTGGKERRLHELVTRLVAQGHRVDVYTMRWWASDGRRGPDRVVRDGITYIALCRRMPLYVGQRRSILQSLVFTLATLRLVTRRFDVLEVDAIPFLPVYGARLVSLVRRRPMVATWHEFWGREYWTEYLGTLGRLAAAAERVAIRLADVVVAASDETGRRLREAGPAGLRLRTIASGVDVAALRSLAAESADPVTDSSIAADVDLVCIGRLLEHKRVAVAVEAVGVLRDRGIDAHLTVVGEGPEAEPLRALVDRLDLADRVDLRPFLPEHRDVLRLLASASMLLFPTVREGFGIAALEALAVGTPVVTSDHPDNLARLLVETDRSGVVCPSTPEAVADAVTTVRASRDELSAGALRSAADHDWAALVTAMEEIHGELV